MKTEEWTPEQDALLGTDTDPKIARALGVHPQVVADRRHTLGVMPYISPKYRRQHGLAVQERIVWTPEMDALLGTDSDSNIAHRLAIQSDQVRQRRVALGLHPAQVCQREWPAEEDAVLGTASIADVAARLMRPTSQVSARMKQLGVEPKGRDLPPTEIVVATLAEKEARKARVHGKEVERRRKIAEIGRVLHEEGSMTKAIERLGISRSTGHRRLSDLLRWAKLPERLGCSALDVAEALNGPPLLAEFAACLSVELDTGSLGAWAELKARIR